MNYKELVNFYTAGATVFVTTTFLALLGLQNGWLAVGYGVSAILFASFATADKS